MAERTISRTEVALHWIVGLGVIMLIGVGNYMSSNEVYSMYPTHKSVGTVLFVIIVWRAVMRLRKGWPEPVSSGKAWEHKLSRVVHWVLILATLAMPISGIVMSVFGGQGLFVFGAELIGVNLSDSGTPTPISIGIARAGAALHGIAGKVIIVALILHILGALKHHFVDRDNTLRRMLGKT